MARRNEEERLTELTKIEREYWAKGILPAGMDEVGRGPLAGPVVTACVILPPEPLIKYVNDSKKVSQGRREKLYPEIKAAAIACATGWKSPEDIDRLNILNATRRAFEEAFRAMEQKPEVVFLDAMTGVDMDAEQHSFIHGDEEAQHNGATQNFVQESCPVICGNGSQINGSVNASDVEHHVNGLFKGVQNIFVIRKGAKLCYLAQNS